MFHGRAAEYVRMSTEHQRYSTANQSDAIRAYAARRGLDIVRTYTDGGKSGLRIEGRDALQQLIKDVQVGAADFDTILVYDVSRWGRFQDADESAYYEYICKRAGLTVQYCAEQFENDGSPVSTIVKGVKRAMAGEYSRELSAKVFAGQCRLIELGYRQGGPAGYGLRRRLIDQCGVRKADLAPGDQKSLQTDRVILIPGPQDELDVVRKIYSMFVDGGIPEAQIAQELNRGGLVTDRGKAWTRGTVHQILINEKYIGNNVWNRTSFKLKKKRVRNAPDMWVRSEKVFDAVIAQNQFDAAQSIIQNRSRRLTPEEMLSGLKALYEVLGHLSGLIIDETDNLPSSSAYQTQFGSLLRAYQAIGFTPARDYSYIQINRALRVMHPTVVSSIVGGIRETGGVVHQHPLDDLLTINDEFTASVVIVRCKTVGDAHRWIVRFDSGLKPDVTVAVRMDECNESPLDYYVLPRLDMTMPMLRMAEFNGISVDSYRFGSLESFFELGARTYIAELAS